MSSSSEEDGVIDMAVEAFIELRTYVQETITDVEIDYSRNTSRRYIQPNCEDVHLRLMNYYFVENALFQRYYFRRRFRMHKFLFMHIV